MASVKQLPPKKRCLPQVQFKDTRRRLSFHNVAMMLAQAKISVEYGTEGAQIKHATFVSASMDAKPGTMAWSVAFPPLWSVSVPRTDQSMLRVQFHFRECVWCFRLSAGGGNDKRGLWQLKTSFCVREARHYLQSLTVICTNINLAAAKFKSSHSGELLVDGTFEPQAPAALGGQHVSTQDSQPIALRDKSGRYQAPNVLLFPTHPFLANAASDLGRMDMPVDAADPQEDDAAAPASCVEPQDDARPDVRADPQDVAQLPMGADPQDGAQPDVPVTGAETQDEAHAPQDATGAEPQDCAAAEPPAEPRGCSDLVSPCTANALAHRVLRTELATVQAALVAMRAHAQALVMRIGQVHARCKAMGCTCAGGLHMYHVEHTVGDIRDALEFVTAKHPLCE